MTAVQQRENSQKLPKKLPKSAKFSSRALQARVTSWFAAKNRLETAKTRGVVGKWSQVSCKRSQVNMSKERILRGLAAYGAGVFPVDCVDRIKESAERNIAIMKHEDVGAAP